MQTWMLAPAVLIVTFCLNYGRMRLRKGKIEDDHFFPVNTNHINN